MERFIVRELNDDRMTARRMEENPVTHHYSIWRGAHSRAAAKRICLASIQAPVHGVSFVAFWTQSLFALNRTVGAAPNQTLLT